MKLPILTTIVLSFLLASCGQNKAKQHQDAVNGVMEKYGDDNDNLEPGETGPQPTAPSAADAQSSLMGEWKCVLVTGDNNSNGLLDENERASGFSTYEDYLKLNPDGTCRYTVARLKGVYDLVEKEGHKSIEVIVKDGSRLKYGRIISLKPDELQLMKFTGGRDIMVYHRL